MGKQKMPHPGHEKHLCFLINIGMQKHSPKEYKELVRDAKFVCKLCGRVAKDRKNLCTPVKL